MEPNEWSIGVHKLRFEPPDICHCYVNGPVAVNEARFAFDIVDREIVPKLGNDFYFVVHLSTGVKGISADTRKYAKTIKPRWKVAIVVGGSTLARAAANMVLRTANLMAGTSVPMRMVGTDDQAYALIRG